MFYFGNKIQSSNPKNGILNSFFFIEQKKKLKSMVMLILLLLLDPGHYTTWVFLIEIHHNPEIFQSIRKYYSHIISILK